MDYLKGVKLKKYEVDVRDDGIYLDVNWYSFMIKDYNHNCEQINF